MDYTKPHDRTALFLRPDFLQPLASIPSSYVVVDVSNQESSGSADIRDAIHMPSKSFLYDNGTLRPVPEVVGILARSGINRDDRVVVYSDTFRSGEAAFVLWLLSYLGQENVLALDGGLDDWTRASLPLETREFLRASANYSAELRPEMLADYDYVKSGAAQAVDARSFQDFGKGRIPGAFFISPDDILEGGLLKPGAQLNDTFAKLDRKRPVVVYSDNLNNASLVWYALHLMGFDSRQYSWQDWQAHETSKVYEIK
jgi:thiosulfate/3-mercaptopyruvate sulfurtransferase